MTSSMTTRSVMLALRALLAPSPARRETATRVTRRANCLAAILLSGMGKRCQGRDWRSFSSLSLLDTSPQQLAQDQFWAAAPHLESVFPVFLKSALHINIANL